MKKYTKAHSVHKLFKFKYPKLALLLCTIVLAYSLFQTHQFHTFTHSLNDYGYLGAFIAGIGFSFGFTTPFAISFFLALQPSNIIFAALLGGLGAMIGDLIIFKTIKFSFLDEFHRLQKNTIVRGIESLAPHPPKGHIRTYITYIFAGIIIVSPLPDELGVSLLAGMTHMKERTFIVLSYTLNTLGILGMLLIGHALA